MSRGNPRKTFRHEKISARKGKLPIVARFSEYGELPTEVQQKAKPRFFRGFADEGGENARFPRLFFFLLSVPCSAGACGFRYRKTVRLLEKIFDFLYFSVFRSVSELRNRPDVPQSRSPMTLYASGAECYQKIAGFTVVFIVFFHDFRSFFFRGSGCG